MPRIFGLGLGLGLGCRTALGKDLCAVASNKLSDRSRPAIGYSVVVLARVG